MKMFFDCSNELQTAEEMLDKAYIRDLVETDRYCRDYGHFDQERACWFDDGQVYASWFKGSIDEFIAKSSRKDKTPSVHKIYNTMVWLNGRRAIAECICMITFRTELEGELVDLSVQSRLHYRVEKRGSRWGLVYFEGIYEKDRIDPVFGDSKFFIPRETLKKFRPCNWNQCARLALYGADSFGGGLDNADEWTGSDKPETIQRLYNESSAWFFASDV